MPSHPTSSYRQVVRNTVGAIGVALAAIGGSEAGGADASAPKTPPPLGRPTMPPMVLGLPQCLALARDKQPTLAAARASLASAEIASRALQGLKAPAFLVPELPIRRTQAVLGVAAATAALAQAERDVDYAVVRTYLTVLYAREQEEVAQRVVDRLTAVKESADLMLKADEGDVTSADTQKLAVYVDLADVRRVQATIGVERAMAALREAIGLGCEPFAIPRVSLPEPATIPCREDVVAFALSRRGELVQSTSLADITCLEVEAQSTNVGFRMETFAEGADLHSQPVPTGSRGGDYQPAALAPEMPDLLVGAKTDRIDRARALSSRASAVADKARHLIVLEAEDAYWRWEEASQKAARAKRASRNAVKLADSLNKDFTTGQKVRVEDVTTAHVLAAQAQSNYLEFLHQQLLALADLERITAGGVCAGIVHLIAQPSLARP